MKLKKGFTLIEILVVVSIIGILTTITMVSLNSAKEKAVGVKSVTELDQLKKALELYRTDNGKYPGEGENGYYTTEIDEEEGQADIITFFTTELINKKYISAIPYYVTYDNDFFYVTGKDNLTSFVCGGNTFSSYMIAFSSNVNNLPLPKITGVNDANYYCLGQ